MQFQAVFGEFPGPFLSRRWDGCLHCFVGCTLLTSGSQAASCFLEGEMETGVWRDPGKALQEWWGSGQAAFYCCIQRGLSI